VSLLFAQLTHAIGLNDVCDALRHHAGKLVGIRAAHPPSRNGLSHANKHRNADMAEALFWGVLEHLQHQHRGFGPAGRYKGLPRRFKRTVPGSRAQYPQRMRRIETEVELNGEIEVMVFITNNLEWAASSIAELYQSRWAIEVFFKQIKQTLKVCDFLGHSKQAIRWQLWTALLLYVLLRFQAWASDWPHSFTRLFTLIRGVLWDRFALQETLRHYGTAAPPCRMRAAPQAAYLPGLAP